MIRSALPPQITVGPAASGAFRTDIHSPNRQSAAQRLVILAETTARSPHSHLSRMMLKDGLSKLDLDDVLSGSANRTIGRLYWDTAQSLAEATSRLQQTASAQIITAMATVRWRRAQVEISPPNFRADLE